MKVQIPANHTFAEHTLQAVNPVSDRSRMREVLNSLILHLHPTRVPAAAIRFTYTWGLGGISALLFVLLAFTGVLLMFRYEPTVDRAYISIQLLETQVAFGSLIRALHHWSANLLVVTVFLHMFRVFFTGGFKQKRAFNWFIGLVLLVLVLVFNFTGYLLPWDQLAYWAITVSSSLLSYIPLIGAPLSNAALGGREVGQVALSNFYALHVAGLPALSLLLLAYHFWRIRKDGGISQPLLPEGEKPVRVTTIPHLVRREVAVGAVVLAAMLVWAMFVPAPLGQIANPLHSPNPAKAAWYLGGIQELLLHIETRAAMLLVAILFAGIALIPAIDRHDANIGIYFRSKVGRRAALVGALLSVDILPLLIIADEGWPGFSSLLPTWSPFVSNGLIPVGLVLIGLFVIYMLIRLVLKANRSEALTGLFAFVMMSFIVLTITCAFFRGPNMALVLPF
ncbi:MAG TPA: cytochrome b N-terminal domain-containing protein [Anaerolineae bacterium]|nr:cytochrome b N-terminal domain-containing protein [Anaerolineae bacterium]HQI85973.1 cytochrome b N-terminal domain-containing protein [Anaerolineae bacterium]